MLLISKEIVSLVIKVNKFALLIVIKLHYLRSFSFKETHEKAFILQASCDRIGTWMNWIWSFLFLFLRLKVKQYNVLKATGGGFWWDMEQATHDNQGSGDAWLCGESHMERSVLVSSLNVTLRFYIWFDLCHFKTKVLATPHCCNPVTSFQANNLISVVNLNIVCMKCIYWKMLII